MLYREAGQYKTNYAADMAVFPILQDREHRLVGGVAGLELPGLAIKHALTLFR